MKILKLDLLKNKYDYDMAKHTKYLCVRRTNIFK